MPKPVYHPAVKSSALDEPTPELSQVAEASWNQAHQRLLVIRELDRKTPRTRADVAVAAGQLGCSVPQAYVLLKRYRANPTVTGLLDRRPGPSIGFSRLGAQIDALIDGAIEKTYLSKQRIRLADLVREIRSECLALGLPPPGRKAITTRLCQRPRALVCERREGRRAARERFQPILGRLEADTRLDLVQIDHTLVDVIVVDSITRAPIQRPWLTVAIDVHSRCVAGFHLSLESPSATSVALCISHAVLPKEGWLAARKIEAVWPVSGLMRVLHLDNGKEFRSEALRRGCEQYGIALEYRPVRTPHYGGHIERLIGTLMGKVHLLPGTTFSNVQEQGAINPEKTASMTLDEIERWLGHAITGLYHQDVHRGIGQTPLAAWKASEGRSPSPRSVADARRLLIEFLPMERRLIRREGIMLHSIAYWSDVLHSMVGGSQPTIVRYDPRDLSRIYWLAPDGEYYDLTYADVRRPPVSLWEHRAARQHLRHEGRRQVDEPAIFRAIEAMRQLATDATAETKQRRRWRERTHQFQAARVAAPPSAGCPPDTTEIPAKDAPLFEVEEWS